MPPRIVRSPVDICLGTSPSQAAKSRPRVKAVRLPIAATSALEMIGPMPGIVISRRQASLFFESASTSPVTASIRSSRRRQSRNQVLQDANHPSGEHICALRKDVRQRMAQPIEALAHRNAMLQQKAADLIDDRSALANEPVAHAMQCLEIELLVRLWRDAARRWALYSFSDRMRIAKVILVCLPERLGIHRRHLPHIVAEGEELAGHIVRSHSCLYTNQACRHIRKPRHNSIACYLLPQNNPTSCVEPDQVQCVLAWVDTNGHGWSVGSAGMGRYSFCYTAPTASSLAGQEHGGSIPFSDMKTRCERAAHPQRRRFRANQTLTGFCALHESESGTLQTRALRQLSEPC